MTRLISASTLILVLAACGGGEEPGGPASVDPTGTEWGLVSGSVEGVAIPLVEDRPITASFDGGSITGTAACNSYGGEYTISGSSLALTNVFHTEMACIPDEIMESERLYLEGLTAVDTIAIENDRLVMRGEGTELVFEARTT